MANEHLKSLRATLEWLKKDSLVLETDREVDPKCEMTALQKRLDGGPPMVFNKEKGYDNAPAVPYTQAWPGAGSYPAYPES